MVNKKFISKSEKCSYSIDIKTVIESNFSATI